MPRPELLSAAKTVRISISEQSKELLTQLARQGIYGRSVADVAGRFVDRELQRLVEADRLDVRAKPLPRKGSR